MRVTLIGDFGNRPDEGMRKICRELSNALMPHYSVGRIDTKEFCSFRKLWRLSKTKPRVLHYLTGPTGFSLIALFLHRLIIRPTPITIATGVRPFLGPFFRKLLPWIHPQVYLAQSRRWANLFRRAGSTIRDFPNGVDLKRFRPVLASDKQSIRNQLEIETTKPLVLHVGHVKESRNLGSLIDVQRSGRYQVMVVGSRSFSDNGDERRMLEQVGCIVRVGYLREIQRVYQAADYYVFTVKGIEGREFPHDYNEIGVIDFPLSVLEAMACGLPVVTTRHDAIEYFFGNIPGVALFDGSSQGCLNQLDALRGVDPDFSEVLGRFSQESVNRDLLDLYQGLGTAKCR